MHAAIRTYCIICEFCVNVHHHQDALLNGGTVRSKSDQDDTEMSSLRIADDRRRSLRENFSSLQPVTKNRLEVRSSSEDDKSNPASSSN